jgi:hypothetical protein
VSAREQIVAAGVRNGEDYFEPGARTEVEHSLCNRCGAKVLVGLDSDVAAMRVTVEVHPVDPMGEFHALMGGRESFAHIMRGKKMVLRHRSAGQIRMHPANTRRVVVTHVCGQPLGVEQPPPPPLGLATWMETGALPPCAMCGLPCVTNPCATCRRAAEGPRPIHIERSETNEADQAHADGEAPTEEASDGVA